MESPLLFWWRFLTIPIKYDKCVDVVGNAVQQARLGYCLGLFFVKAAEDVVCRWRVLDAS